MKRLDGGEGFLSAVKLFTLGWKKSKWRQTGSTRRSDTDLAAGPELAAEPLWLHRELRSLSLAPWCALSRGG